MAQLVENSFFSQDYSNLCVMVIVPHQDDEINTAGALLSTFVRCGAQIVLVYTTNGDWKYPAARRMKEAIKAASILGISEEQIIFLGYGDSIASEQKDHLFYSQKDPAILNCTPFVRQYGILKNKRGALLCQKEYQTNDMHQNSVVGSVKDFSQISLQSLE